MPGYGACTHLFRVRTSIGLLCRKVSLRVRKSPRFSACSCILAGGLRRGVFHKRETYLAAGLFLTISAAYCLFPNASA